MTGATPDRAPPLIYRRPEVAPADAARACLDAFGVGGSCTELPSERDRNFLVDAGAQGRFVFKLSNETEERSLLELQHEALRRVEARAPELRVPRVRPTIGGPTIAEVTAGHHRHFASLLTWVEGRPLATVAPRTPDQLRALGRVLGQLDAALAGLDLPAARRALKWDLAGAGWIVSQLDVLATRSQRTLVERLFERYLHDVAPIWHRLPQGVVHNDANDHNVLVAPGSAGDEVGLIDFGDLVWTARVAEPAIAAAYGLLGTGDPLAAVAHVVEGYHGANPLTEPELAAAYPLVCARLCVSVVNSALQRRADPDNRYLLVSEAPAWEAIERLDAIHPRLAHYRLRDAAGLPPCPGAARVSAWVEAHGDDALPVVAADSSDPPPARIDLSVGSHFVPELSLLADEPALSRRIRERLAARGARLGLGEYDEARLVYSADQFRTEGWDRPEWRTVHLGLDLFAPAGTPVRAPIAGRVHSLRDNAAPGDYGPTVILEHAVRDATGPLSFWTLYGHLDGDTLRALHPGLPVQAGGVVGRLGTPAVNGGWPPHVHFQLIADLLDRRGEFPGVARPSERRVWTSLSPAPHRLAGVRRQAADGATVPTLLDRRRAALGGNLSIAYRTPLHIVRGWMQHLFDADGQRYLDAVNNVPHVGHSHPAVVAAGRRQMGVLNTNTRYLHDTVLRYAERLGATLPEPLRICFFVNSGSEANELALRLAWTHTGRRGTVVLDAAYHGNTATLVSLSPYKCDGPGGGGLAPFARKVPLPDPYRGLHRGDGADLGERYAAHVAAAFGDLAAEGAGAFLAESIPSCGGQVVLPPGYLRAAYAHARAAGAVCIADEVQVGFGRVGTHFWAFETQAVVPDIVVLGKPAGNGHPLGVVVTTPEIARSFANGMEFFSTFGGNPVSAAIGLAVLDVIERERLQWRALEVGNMLLGRLRDLAARHEAVGDARGLGLFLGVELVADRERRTPSAAIASYVANRMRDKGVLLSTDGPDHNVLKIKPPLVFGPADADLLVRRLEEVLAEDRARP